MKIRTSLLSGAGNTFHLVSDTQDMELSIDAVERKKIAQAICKKDFADGFIFLKKNHLNILEWIFYNNDGSDAEMCGNATRCVGFYVKNILKDSATEWKLLTAAGEVKIKSLNEEVFQVVMPPIVELVSKHGFYCNTGVPHLVLPVANLHEAKKLKAAARKLRNDNSFAPQGTNITYIEILNKPNKIKAISYERGVEDFTNACGTGALAAAFYNFKKHAVIETNVEMPGGMLIMNLADLKKPVMTGPAVLVGSKEYEI